MEIRPLVDHRKTILAFLLWHQVRTRPHKIGSVECTHMKNTAPSSMISKPNGKDDFSASSLMIYFALRLPITSIGLNQEIVAILP